MPANYKRDMDFFTKVSERHGPIRAIDLDREFNNIVNYFNNSLGEFLDRFIEEHSIASKDPANINAFYRDKGDGTPEWTKIDTEHFLDDSILFSTIIRPNSVSVIVSDESKKLVYLSPKELGECFISKENGGFAFSKISSDLIEEQTISNEHFQNYGLQNSNLNLQIKAGSATTNKFALNSLDGSKFVDNAFNETILGTTQTNNFIGRDNANLMFLSNILPDECINDYRLVTTPIIWSELLIDDFKIPKRLYVNNCFKKENLVINSISGSKLKDNAFSSIRVRNDYGTVYPLFNEIMADGAIEFQNLSFWLQQAITKAITP